MMDKYINLWDETVDELKEHGKEPKDIQFVCGNDFGLINFEDLAKRTDYDNGYGGQAIAADLKVVGKDWWLERHEYDGAEWWEYKELPKKPEAFEVMETLEGDTLKEIKEGDNWYE